MEKQQQSSKRISVLVFGSLLLVLVIIISIVALASHTSSSTSKDEKSPLNASTRPTLPFSTEYCSLDMELDDHLLFITCPRVNHANGGFAMDTMCKSGEKCVYACEPPYVSTRNGFSNDDCVPYLNRCGVYDPKSYVGGVICNEGVMALQYPTEPMCAMGLQTAYVLSTVPQVISSCQTVYPGNESPMIGLEVHSGENKVPLTSFPSWYWQHTHAHFYVNVPGTFRDEACQWNYDPLSLNSGGVDTMPYIIGGGALVNHPCHECGQHNLDFGENFDYKKSSLPSFGIRVKNCNSDDDCSKILCQATYTYDARTDTLTAYWVKYNTIYGPDTVGCVVDAVAGSSWEPSSNLHKYTIFKYFPIDDVTGKDTSSSSGEDTFDAAHCRKIKNRAPARVGTGNNPALFVCEAIDGAAAAEHTLVQWP